MAGEQGGAPGNQRRGGIVDELAAAGFVESTEVGRGGAGVVYRSYQTSLGRWVAVKVLASGIDVNNRERFLREGLAMGKLAGHPNIANILHVGVTDSGQPYIVMTYHAAGSLAQRIHRSGRVAWPEALRIGVKLCGALETAHRAGTLHRDIKPANVMLNDYGEPQLSDFGIARITGGYETATGFFTGTIAYTAPDVLAGSPSTVQSDVYSLGATIYALISGAEPYDRKSGEELIAHYLRITSTQLPDMRGEGIPPDVCAVIEKAMARVPEKRYSSAEEFGHELRQAQRHNGLTPDSMALSESHADLTSPTAPRKLPEYPKTEIVTGSEASANPSGPQSPVSSVPPAPPTAQFYSMPPTPAPFTPPPPPPPSVPPTSGFGPPSGPGGPYSGPPSGPHGPYSTPPPPPPPGQDGSTTSKLPPRNVLIAAAAAVMAVVLVVATIVFVSTGDDATSTDSTSVASQPTSTEPPPAWEPITNARVAREGAATTEADGTIWIFGGREGDDRISGRHEGYDPAIDNWKGGNDLPVPVQYASAVTWQDNPVVLGGWRDGGNNTRVATDQVWRVVSGQWVDLPPLLQPRAAAAAAVVGDKIIVTGGVDAAGKVLATTEVFDGREWKPGAPMPTPRQMLRAAADDKLVYAVGGNNGSDLTTVEAYDPAADTWTALPPMAEPRSDLGVAIADRRLVVAGGEAGGQTLATSAALDLSTSTWSDLPDLATARHGAATAGVGKTVYVIGGSTGAGDNPVTSTAEALKLPARKAQPASAWKALPDAQTPRLMTAWTVADDKIWIMGGMLGKDETLDTVETYNPKTGDWDSQPPLPVPLNHAAATTYKNEVVVIGGAEDALADASNKVFAMRDDEWVELPSLQYPRAAAAAAVVGDKLYVVGGQNEKKTVPQTEVFDGEKWTTVADLPTPREHLAAVSDGRYLYTVGGRFLAADKNSAAVERFDPESGEWEKLIDMPTPRGSYGAAYLDGRIVAVGGEEPTQVLATVEMYDISTGKWSTLTPMSTPRHGEVVAAVDSAIFVIGGADRPSHEGPVGTVEELPFT